MRILWDNKITDDNISVNSEDADYPIANIVDTRLSRKFRTEANDNIRLTIDENISASYLFLLKHNIPEDATVRLDAWNDDLIVAVGIGEIQTSLDGTNWTVRTPDDSYASTIYRICHGGGQYVIVGQVGEIQTSPDGINWTHRDCDDSYTGEFRDICYGDGLYVAVGLSAEIQTSPDGITWTVRTPDDSFAGHFITCGYGGGLYVIAGQGGEIQTSPDGITWTHRDPDDSFSGYFYSMGYGDGLHVLGGASGEVQTSPDGITWTTRTLGGGYTGHIEDICYSGSLYVLVGSGGGIQTSPDGITWSARTQDDSFAGYFYGVDFVNNIYVAVGAGGEIQTSPDGITWTTRTPDDGYSSHFYCVAGVSPSIDIGTVSWSDDYIYIALTESNYDNWQLFIDFDNDSNNDDYIEIGYLYLGTYLQMPPMKPDQVIGDATTSRDTLSDSGQLYGDEGYDYINPKINYPHLTNAQRAGIRSLWASRKNIRPFIMLIWESELTTEGPIYCKIDQNKIEWKKRIKPGSGLMWSTSIKFREVF